MKEILENRINSVAKKTRYDTTVLLHAIYAGEILSI